jgi:hypothetical protein
MDNIYLGAVLARFSHSTSCNFRLLNGRECRRVVRAPSYITDVRYLCTVSVAFFRGDVNDPKQLSAR